MQLPPSAQEPPTFKRPRKLTPKARFEIKPGYETWKREGKPQVKTVKSAIPSHKVKATPPVKIMAMPTFRIQTPKKPVIQQPNLKD